MARARAVRIRAPGGPEVLELVDVEVPDPGPGQVLVEVAASALNRADLLQRRGLYPAPPGSPLDIPGLEYAGRVAVCGEGVSVAVGDPVMGVARSAFARHVITDARHVVRRPASLDAVAAAATTRRELVAAGSGLLAHGHPSRARALGQRLATMGGERDGDTWRLLYVLPYAGELRASAEAAGLDPWLVAAVIRQESAFEPRARSAADARGLMQLLPGSGRDLARSLGIRDFDPALLWQPGLNLAMGTRHFAKELGRYPERERSLAAYNAGPGRVAQWSRTLLDGSAVGDDQHRQGHRQQAEDRGRRDDQRDEHAVGAVIEQGAELRGVATAPRHAAVEHVRHHHPGEDRERHRGGVAPQRPRRARCEQRTRQAQQVRGIGHDSGSHTMATRAS